jgi:hypothetical protein
MATVNAFESEAVSSATSFSEMRSALAFFVMKINELCAIKVICRGPLGNTESRKIESRVRRLINLLDIAGRYP